MAATFQQRYLTLVSEIEKNFAVWQWKRGDVDIWPLARMDLFLDMHWRHTGQISKRPSSAVRRVLDGLGTPLRNIWKCRHHLRSLRLLPFRAHAVLLGDGVSLDLVEGAWRDRYGEPLIAEFERRGQSVFSMQAGAFDRQPHRRPSFAANTIDAGSRALALLDTVAPSLPDLDAVMGFLKASGVEAPSLGRTQLKRRAATVHAAARLFGLVLRIARPRLAFVVTYYAGLGPAFLLACRRQGVLSVDLQHCPQCGAHKAYGWCNLPADGCTTLPAVFWNWTADDAAYIGQGTKPLAQPWHQPLFGGNTQIAAYLPVTPTGRCARFEREILVTLQPIAGQTKTWNALAAAIEASPRDWRWWIRRHPASTPAQDGAFGRLLALRSDRVLVEEASHIPLPDLLRSMTAQVSLMSGAAWEAAAFGVPAFFLSPEAQGNFGALIARGEAHIVFPESINAEIQALLGQRLRRTIESPPLGESIGLLEIMADNYECLVREAREATNGQ